MKSANKQLNKSKREEIGEVEIKRLKEEAASKPPDQIFQIKINVGKLVKESLDKKREECASSILDVLEKEAVDHCSHDVMDDSMIMNNAFLIERDRYEVFEDKVNQEIKTIMVELIEKEQEHREYLKSFLIILEKNDNETFSYQEGIMKKYVQSVLYLEKKKKDPKSQSLEIFYSVAAGVAMFFSLF